MGQQLPYKILHVEDDLLDAALVKEFFYKPSGDKYQIVHVDDLKHALEALQSGGYSAVLLDLGLSDLQGVDNVRVIKEENPELPIVVLTGLDDEEMAIEAIRNGAQEYIVKGHGNDKVLRMAVKSSIERKMVERKFFRQANFDDLTHLPNRRLFMEYLESNLHKAARWARHETLLFLDIDDFKHVNDTYGHEAGNALLVQVAERLKKVLRATDLVCRYGGDEFTILLDDRSEDTKYASGRIVTKMMETLDQPFYIGDFVIQVTCSVGIAVYPEAGKDVYELIESADAAMYEAKRAGGGRFQFAAMNMPGKDIHSIDCCITLSCVQALPIQCY